MSACATGASSAVTCCCLRPSAAALPGERPWCATSAATPAVARFGQKKTPRKCAAFFRNDLSRRLLRDRTLEHAVDLLVGRIAARLAGMSRGQRLVRSAL